MPIIYTNDEHYKNIASKLREFTTTDEQLYPKDMADKVGEVFQFGFNTGNEAGYDEGYKVGYNSGANKGFEEGIEQGKQAERLRRWNIRQDNGNRKSFVYGFAGAGWTEETFDPVYDMHVSNANGMFMYSAIKADLVKHIEKLNVVLDFSNNAGVLNTFANTDFIRIGSFGSKTATVFTSTFANSEFLEIIDEFVLGTAGTQTFSSTFQNNTKLWSIRITGKIGTAFDIHWSPLDKESLLSIANAVLNKTFTIKFNLNAVNKAFETSEGANDGSTSDEWTNLWKDKPNVTVSLQNV